MRLQAAKRALKNKCLSFLAALKDDGVTQQLLHRFREATCMTDRTAALACLSDTPGEPAACTIVPRHSPGHHLQWLTKWDQQLLHRLRQATCITAQVAALATSLRSVSAFPD